MLSAVVVGGADVCVVAGAVVVGPRAAVVEGAPTLAVVLDVGASPAFTGSDTGIVSDFARRVVDVDDGSLATTAAELAVDSFLMVVSVFPRPKMNAPTATVMTSAPTSSVVIA